MLDINRLNMGPRKRAPKPDAHLWRRPKGKARLKAWKKVRRFVLHRMGPTPSADLMRRAGFLKVQVPLGR